MLLALHEYLVKHSPELLNDADACSLQGCHLNSKQVIMELLFQPPGERCDTVLLSKATFKLNFKIE